MLSDSETRKSFPQTPNAAIPIPFDPLVKAHQTCWKRITFPIYQWQRKEYASGEGKGINPRVWGRNSHSRV